MASVGVIGASGFTGAELLRLLAGHPDLEVTVATGDTQAGVRARDLYPDLAAAYPDLVFEEFEPRSCEGLDLVFCALPHGASQAVMGDLLARVPHVIDLGADFRLQDATLYPVWYGEPHQAPDLLADFVYGLPEVFRDRLRGAAAIAVPGCYPTTATLALAPFVRHGLVDPSRLIVDAASGVSGAGRPPKPHTTFCAVDEDFTAYGLLDHRHTPEIEQNLRAVAPSSQQVEVLFTPHLAPMNRGILATCYGRPATTVSTASLLEALHADYDAEPFVIVTEQPPSTKATLGSNTVQVTARYDPRTGWVIALAALDNLVKGASGQAVQCANLALGIEETAGLSTIGIYP
ncbi:MAG: N-acetyl-gamma-glutamyl-phosphate reductase [Acidimicrobiales bacterium]|nr:N-acetyl-gamma-glutamyl-phosphate reductase [Acidimicrobiales bacterium]